MEGPSSQALPSGSRDENRKAALLIVSVCLGSFVVNLSASLLNIGIVDISNSFDMPIHDVKWTITAFLLTLTILLPIMGQIGDQIEKRTLYNFGINVFLIGVIGAAVSGIFHSYAMLLASRIVQGVGASMYQATNLALVVSHVPAAQKGKAVGFISTAVALGVMLGPSIGGMLLEFFSWPVLFWFVLPIALLASLLSYLFIPHETSVSKQRHSLDIVGTVLFGGAAYFIMVSFQQGAVGGWDQIGIWAGLLATAVAVFILIRRSRSRARTILPKDVLQNKGIVAGLHVNFFSYISAFTLFSALPVMMINGYEFTPTLAGVIMMCYPIILVFSSPYFGAVSDKWGTEKLIAFGMLCMAASLVGMALIGTIETLAAPAAWFALIASIMGVGMGMMSSPINTRTMNQAQAHQRSTVTSLLAVTRNFGMAVGSSIGLTAAGLGTSSAYMIFFIMTASILISPLLHLRMVSGHNDKPSGEA